MFDDVEDAIRNREIQAHKLADFFRNFVIWPFLVSIISGLYTNCGNTHARYLSWRTAQHSLCLHDCETLTR
jgi:hypothetical protein